jgi:hypothetical protein
VRIELNANAANNSCCSACSKAQVFLPALARISGMTHTAFRQLQFARSVVGHRHPPKQLDLRVMHSVIRTHLVFDGGNKDIDRLLDQASVGHSYPSSTAGQLRFLRNGR